MNSTSPFFPRKTGNPLVSKPPCQMHVRRGGVELRGVCLAIPLFIFVLSKPNMKLYMHEDQHPCIVRGMLLDAN